MKASKIIEMLKDIDGEVYIQIGDDAYPAKIRLFKEGGKVIPYITLDNTKEHRNFPEKYGIKEII
jgi:hypothetical protein